MRGGQGKRIPSAMRTLTLKTAAEDPTRTNAEIVRLIQKRFGYGPDQTWVQRTRKEAKIPSSREAKKHTAIGVTLTTDQKKHASELLSKIVLPHPDQLRQSDVVHETGIGNVGPRGKEVHVKMNKTLLTECWLTEREINTLLDHVLEPEAQKEFRALIERGIGIVGTILRHNRAVDFGSGESTFLEVSRLLETSKPNQLNMQARRVSDLWDLYTSVARDLEEFKQTTSETLSPFPISA